MAVYKVNTQPSYAFTQTALTKRFLVNGGEGMVWGVVVGRRHDMQRVHLACSCAKAVGLCSER